MKTIFFDLDDTLYFRRDAFYIAFEKFFNSLDKDLQKRSNDTCRIRGDEVFYDAQQGKITMEQMYIYRFQKGFADCGIVISEKEALDFQSLYKKELYSLKLNSEVIKMLDFAKSNFEQLGIITNGPVEHQWNKVKNLGLDKWIEKDLTIVSAEYSVDKPDVKLFNIASQKACKKTDELIIIGDSFKNDIIPASSLGWHSIWIDLYGENFTAPEYQVKNISEIIPVLKKFL